MCLTSAVSDASWKLCILQQSLWYANTFHTAELELSTLTGLGGIMLSLALPLLLSVIL